MCLADVGCLAVADCGAERKYRTLHVYSSCDETARTCCPYEDCPSDRSKEIISQHRAVNAVLMKTRGTKPVWSYSQPPVGMMLIGRKGEDATVLRAVDAFQREIFDAPRPPAG